MKVGGQRHASAPLPPEKGPGTRCTETDWVSGPVWTGTENLAPSGIRFLDRVVPAVSLYPFRCPHFAAVQVVIELLCKLRGVAKGPERWTIRGMYGVVGKVSFLRNLAPEWGSSQQCLLCSRCPPLQNAPLN